MGRKGKREKNTGEISIFFGFPSKKGRGQWYRVSKLLMAALGWRDELVLRTNHDFYNAIRHNLLKDDSYYLSYPKHKKINGLSACYQIKAYENFYRLRLIEPSESNAPDNTVARKINMHATWTLFWLIHHHEEVIRKKYRKRKKKLAYEDKCLKLNRFYKKLLKSDSLAKRFRNFVKQLEIFTDYDAEELESGEWDEKLLDFYDELCKRR